MKRSKKILALMLAVLMVLTTVVSATVVSASASGTLASYYSTNPNGQIGKKTTITVDDSISDWDSSMLIAQGTANDDPRVYRPNSMYEIPHDTYALYGAYDDSNIYLMWEMVNVQDVVAPWDTYPLSQGVMFQTMNIPFFIAIDTGASDVIGNNGALTTGGTIWDSGITISTGFNRLIAISTNGSNGPFLYSGDSTGLNPKEIAARAETGIQFGYGLGILSKNIYGIDGGNGLDHNRVLGDMCNEDAAWVDFNTMGHSSSTMDFHYEMAIPYKALGITAADVEANGIGALVIMTSGKSGMDCLPYDLSMNDQADLDDSAGSQENNSFEKSDEDNITCSFARIGKLGSGIIAPPATKPIETEPATTTAPVEEPTTVTTPVATEPSEVITTVGPTEGSDPIVIPPVVEPSETTPTEATTETTSAIEVPTLDFGGDTTPTETTAATTTAATAPSVPVVDPVTGILGDADGNGIVNIKDATLIQKHLAKITTLDDVAQKLSDVDGNDELNIRDVTAIQKWLAKLDVDFAIGEPVEGEEIIIPVPTTVAKPTEVPTTTETPVVIEPTTAEPTTAATEPTEVPTTAEPTTASTEPTTALTEPTTAPTDPVYTEPVYTDPYQPEVGTITIYFENTYGWNSVYWHAWNEAGATNTPWPGDMMTNVSGNIYSATISSEFTGIIFNDGSGSDSAKTEDTYVGGDGQMFSNGSWTAYDPNNNGGGGNDDPYNPPSGDGRRVYFSNNKFWSTVNAYTWPTGGEGSWPGVAMTLAGQNEHGEDIYYFDVPAGHDNIIFNDGNAQTVDISLTQYTQNGFYISGEDSGKFTVEQYDYVG